MRPVASWGRLAVAPHDVRVPRDIAGARAAVAGGGSGIAFGCGRSYGDVCLNPGGVLWDMSALDSFIEFDEETGLLRCEAGVLLGDIQRLFAPRGWMLAVTPGTQFVTVGGAIANDVHGKNHHGAGSFGAHVASLQLARTDGTVLRCDARENAPLFAATLGGMGLTGVILEATLRLARVPGPWLEAETLPFTGLDDFFALSAAAQADWDHTVAWIDCLAPRVRGLFLRGRPVAIDEGPAPARHALPMPVTPPFSLVNALTLRLFNAAYYAKGRIAPRAQVVHYEPFFYPLDGIREWNRMYGPRGFYQYQCVLPPAAGRDGIAQLLAAIARSGEGSFLAVLKAFGDIPSPGMLGFPMSGVTLALDFPNRGERTLQLFASLDGIVRAAGGRLYPAKDARMPRELFEAGYPRLAEFLPYRDPGISSAMSRRLMGS